jgi:hypothetical protein
MCQGHPTLLAGHVALVHQPVANEVQQHVHLRHLGIRREENDRGDALQEKGAWSRTMKRKDKI